MTWWLLEFSRGGSARYLSHLDTARAMERTFARAGVGICLSCGMRPKPRLGLPFPLPVGAAGTAELVVVEVPETAPAPIEALKALRAAAPPGLEPTKVIVAGEAHPRPQPVAARYACVVDGDAGRLGAAVERYEGQREALCERVSPKGRRALDLKDYIGDAVAEAIAGGVRLRFTISHRADGAARPQEFVDLIAGWAGADPVMRELERGRITWKGVAPGLGLGHGRSGSS